VSHEKTLEGRGRYSRSYRGGQGGLYSGSRGAGVQSLMELNFPADSGATYSFRGNEGQIYRGTRGRQGSFDNLAGMASGAALGGATYSFRGNESQIYRGTRGRQGSFDNLADGMASGAARGGRFGFRSTSDDTDSLSGDTSARSKQKLTRDIPIPNEVGAEKCTLLIFLLEDLKQFGCTFIVNKKTHTVSVYGTSENSLEKTEELVYQKLCAFQSIELNKMSTPLSNKLSSQKGLMWISEQCKENGLRAASYVKDGRVCLLAENDSTARNVEQLLTRLVDKYDIPYDNLQLDFIKSSDWKNFISSVEKDAIITVQVLSSPIMCVRLEGVATHVNDAAAGVEKLLKEKCVVVEEVHISCRSEVRYLKEYYKDYW